MTGSHPRAPTTGLQVGHCIIQHHEITLFLATKKSRVVFYSNVIPLLRCLDSNSVILETIVNVRNQALVQFKGQNSIQP